MTRPAWVVLAGTALTTLPLTACSGGGPQVVAVPPVRVLAPGATTGADLAAAACVRLRLARQGVLADAPAATVREELAEARELATEAARRDPTFIALSGGIAALDEALRRDAGPDAVLGLQVALANCLGSR